MFQIFKKWRSKKSKISKIVFPVETKLIFKKARNAKFKSKKFPKKLLTLAIQMDFSKMAF
jgi:hypothetical protein